MRSTIKARAVWVVYGMTSKLAQAPSPQTVIMCWRLCCHPCQLKSGGRCNGGQLTLMEAMPPSKGVRTATRLGNSLVSRSARGHHAPSMARPSSRATDTRIGLARRRVSTGRVIGASPLAPGAHDGQDHLGLHNPRAVPSLSGSTAPRVAGRDGGITLSVGVIRFDIGGPPPTSKRLRLRLRQLRAPAAHRSGRRIPS